MRITFITPADSFTGGIRVIATYAKSLQQLGHSVLILCASPDRPGGLRLALRALRRADLSGAWRAAWQGFAPLPSQAGHISNSGVPFVVFERPSPPASMLPDADLLIATWWETAVWVDAMPASKGRKVHLIQGYEIWTGGDVRLRVHAALRLPNRKIAISSQLKFDIEAELGDLDIRVVPNAVDLVLFDAPNRERGDPPTVGFTYSRQAIKGSDIIHEACRLARQDIPDLRILAFGSEHPTEELPLPPDTEFHYCPPQDQIAGLYARCDAWLFASRLDSFGLPILESMACRTPVIGVPIGAAPELLDDGAGVLVPAESPEAMATALVALLRSPPEAWKRMSTISYQRAHSYSWDDATALLLKAIGDLP